MTIVAPTGDRHFSANVFQEPGYQRRYDRIYSVMTRYFNDADMAGKKVVDLGCGLGGFGRKFLDLGAEVVFLDGREENITDLSAELPDATALVMDVENDTFPAEAMDADLVLCMGLIYHTSDPVSVIRKIAGITDNMFLETNCLDHDGHALVWFTESTEPRQFSLTGNACRPSPGWVSAAIEEADFDVVRDISHKDADQEPRDGYPGELFSWEFQRSCGWRRNECSLRRLFLATSNDDGLISVTN